MTGSVPTAMYTLIHQEMYAKASNMHCLACAASVIASVEEMKVESKWSKEK
jgi:copper chaperone CopZ